MAGGGLKRTVKNETLRPYALSSESPWLGIAYRFDEAEPWQNALLSPFVPLPSNREDVRLDVIHAFDINVDVNAVRADGIDPDQVDVVVLTRDGFAKKILTLLHESLGERSRLSLIVPRSTLESTSLSARIDFHIMLVARSALQRGQTKIRRGGRLATHVVSVSAEKKGHSFNFSKTSAAEFERLGLPKSTTFHLSVDSPQALVEQCDDVSSALLVLVHEDAWSTLQEIRSGDRIGEAVGAMFLSNVIFNVLVQAKNALVQERGTLEEGSVTKRLLGWLTDKSGKSVDELEQMLFDDGGVLVLQALVQESIRVTNSLNRVRLAQEDEA